MSNEPVLNSSSSPSPLTVSRCRIQLHFGGPQRNISSVFRLSCLPPIDSITSTNAARRKLYPLEKTYYNSETQSARCKLHKTTNPTRTSIVTIRASITNYNPERWTAMHNVTHETTNMKTEMHGSWQEISSRTSNTTIAWAQDTKRTQLVRKLNTDVNFYDLKEMSQFNSQLLTRNTMYGTNEPERTKTFCYKMKILNLVSSRFSPCSSLAVVRRVPICSHMTKTLPAWLPARPWARLRRLEAGAEGLLGRNVAWSMRVILWPSDPRSNSKLCSSNFSKFQVRTCDNLIKIILIIT